MRIDYNKKTITQSNIDELSDVGYSVHIGSEVKVEGKVVIPSNIEFEFSIGGQLILNEDTDLTFNSTVVAGEYQHILNRRGGKLSFGSTFPVLSICWMGAIPGNSVDNQFIIENCLKRHHNVYIPPGVFYLRRTVNFRKIGQRLFGLKGFQYGGHQSELRPTENFSGKSLVRMSNRNDDRHGGQNNTVSSIKFDGIRDHNNSDGVVGIDFMKTKDHILIEKCSFERLGYAFKGSGWIHNVNDCDINNCYNGFYLQSNNSSSISRLQVQTCTNQWGKIFDTVINDSTIQQGSENQSIKSEIGLVCTGVCTLNNIYFEGGNAQVYVNNNSYLTVNSSHFGFTTSASNNVKHSKIKLTKGASFHAINCRMEGPSSTIFEKEEDSKIDLQKFKVKDSFLFPGVAVKSMLIDEYHYPPRNIVKNLKVTRQLDQELVLFKINNTYYSSGSGSLSIYSEYEFEVYDFDFQIFQFEKPEITWTMRPKADGSKGSFDLELRDNQEFIVKSLKNDTAKVELDLILMGSLESIQ